MSRLALLRHALRPLTIATPVLSTIAGYTLGSKPPNWASYYAGAITWDPVTSTGTKVRARWSRNGGSTWTSEADQPLTSDVELIGDFTWPLLATADLSSGGPFMVEEQQAYFLNGIETLTSNWSPPWSDVLS